MSLECPSCHRDAFRIYECVDCGRMYCFFCDGQIGHLMPWLAVKELIACPKCGGQGEIVSEDADDHEHHDEETDDWSSDNSEYRPGPTSPFAVIVGVVLLVGVFFWFKSMTDNYHFTPPAVAAPVDGAQMPPTPPPLVSDPSLPTFSAVTLYSDARSRLSADGWTPVHMPGAEVCQPDDERCQGFDEMYFCSGTGQAACGYLWRRENILIEILAIGEGQQAYAATVSCRVKEDDGQPVCNPPY
jgi:hypothetical protein